MLILFIGFNFYGQVTIVVQDYPKEASKESPIFISGDFEGWSGGKKEYQLQKIGDKYSITLPKIGNNINFKFTQGSWASVESDKKGLSLGNRTYVFNKENDTLKVENPYHQKEIYKMAISGYESLTKDFPQLEYQFSSVKSSSMSLLQTYNGTSGYLNPLTGEAQVNDKIPKSSYPTTTCHEMAHQIGFAAENEANFVGFLAANYNEDMYFKYASYRMAFGYCIREVRKRDRNASKELWKTVNIGIIKDFNASYDFWQAYKNPFEPFVKKGYNAYLKANKQDKGVDSYDYVVDLLISYFETSNEF